MTTPANRSFLTKVMYIDGAFSLLSGAVFSAFSTEVSSRLGPLAPPAFVLTLGLLLIGWGIFHVVAARSANSIAVKLAIAGDAVWVVASLVVLIALNDGLTSVGFWAVALVTVIVADMLFLKSKGLKRQAA